MRRRSLLAGVVLLAACWPPGGSCPAPEKTVVLATGAYQTGETNVSERKTMQLDRTNGVVTISYSRAGKAVVERWRIKQIAQNSY